MKLSLSLSAIFLATLASAQSPSQTPTSTITVTPGCPSAAPADVMVTRSGVAVPSCAAGNETKPSIVSMPGYGANMTGGSGSATASAPATQFTGGAGKNAAGIMVVGGIVAALFV